MVKNIIIYIGIVVLGILFFTAMVLFIVPAIQESTLFLPSIKVNKIETNEAGTEKVSLETDIDKLQAKLNKYQPTGSYMIVNTTYNHFYLYKGSDLIRDGVCSSGKNERLIVGGKKKEYDFYTPKGVRTVLRKQPNPVWAKPDWAFIEDGMPIPPRGDPSRFESGTLGAYKLEIGDGYMIHGTIYKRFIGKSVTHGCIRLLDEDLEAVYKNMAVGSKVYIY